MELKPSVWMVMSNRRTYTKEGTGAEEQEMRKMWGYGYNIERGKRMTLESKKNR